MEAFQSTGNKKQVGGSKVPSNSWKFLYTGTQSSARKVQGLDLASEHCA